MKPRSRPSYADVAATLALFGVLAGGTAVALPGKNSVDSGDIARNGVKSSDLKNGGVKGTDVLESSLAEVPSAADASAVDGNAVARFAVDQTANTAAATVLDFKGLRLSMACDGSVDGELSVASTIADATVYSVTTDSEGTVDDDFADRDLDPGESPVILSIGDVFSSQSGELRYRAGEAVVTVDYATDAVGGRCRIWGTAIGA